MQPSAGPDHPHTRAQTVHWLATGVGIAAVVVAFSLARPPGAAASSDAAAQDLPNATAVRYPVDCAGGPVDVVGREAVDMDADGRTELVAEVRCHTETGTPPSGLYVLQPGPWPGDRPRIVATLLSPTSKYSLTGLTSDGRTVTAAVHGYSSDRIPRCCPDLERQYSWVWRDGRFLAQAGPHSGDV